MVVLSPSNILVSPLLFYSFFFFLMKENLGEGEAIPTPKARARARRFRIYREIYRLPIRPLFLLYIYFLSYFSLKNFNPNFERHLVVFQSNNI